MRSALATIGRGFLLGAGFSVALAIAYYFVERYTFAHTAENLEAADAQRRDAALKGVSIAGVEERKVDSDVSFIGSVKNAGSAPVRGINLVAELFRGGKFVDECSEYMPGYLPSGESRNFKITCGSRRAPAADHDSYKVDIRSIF
jgi:hypothetical protein